MSYKFPLVVQIFNHDHLGILNIKIIIWNEYDIGFHIPFVYDNFDIVLIDAIKVNSNNIVTYS